MSESLAARLGIGKSELVAIVGGGGKSTLLFSLGDELAAAGSRVVLTTTTKLGAEQAAAAPTLCRSADAGAVARALSGPRPVMLVTGGDDHKVIGPAPSAIDVLFGSGVADHLLVEADGARGRPFKAPAGHEPVVPSAATIVVIVMGADAIGGVIRDVCHRPEIVAALAGTDLDSRLDPRTCASVLAHRRGGLKRVPRHARAVVAITKVAAERADAAAEIATALEAVARIDRVVLFPQRPRPPAPEANGHSSISAA